MQRLLEDAYVYAISANETYERYQERWEYLLESYVGGEDYRRAAHLTQYQLETGDEYQARLDATPLDNHCKSVISVYISFLFRNKPYRDLGSIENDPALRDFLRDADYDGRSLDAFMKEVSIYASIFGHSFVMVTKPNISAQNRAEEIAQGVRPYLSILSPLVVTDWSWNRSRSGKYTLDYIKYIEDVNGDETVIKEWNNETITTTKVNTGKREVIESYTEDNQLGMVPVVIAYNQRAVVRGLGISDIADIADHQKKIYNEYSEVEQSIRLNGHPALVKTPSVEAVGGAGAVVSMPEDMDPGLKPYLLDTSTDIGSIYNSIQASVDAIDKMANTGAVRATESRTMSGVAMETEFALLNAKLSEKADNLELAEENIWRLYAMYQGYAWDGEIEYPGSFNIRDTANEITQLRIAKETVSSPKLIKEIDKQVAEWMGLDDDVLETPKEEREEYSEEPFEPHMMYGPNGETQMANTMEQHLELAAQGWTHE
jgi:hypothetical protein